MKWRARLLGFLLICSLLIGLNVLVTISGMYTPLPAREGSAEAPYHGESSLAAFSQPWSENR
jgi:hypothetical protein